MKEILNLIGQIGTIRKVPQFFYYYGIRPEGAIKVREAVIEYKQKNNGDKFEEVDFILNSSGGIADDAYRIIRTLKKNFTTVNVIIPFWAKSAATLLALGANRIIMDEFAEFGPLDVQLPKERDDNPFIDPDDLESALIDEISLETIEKRSHSLFLQMFLSIYTNELIPINKNDLANDIMNYLSKFYEPIISQINPYKIGDKKRKLDIGAQYTKRILDQYNSHISQRERARFIDFIVNDCPDHGYVIDYDLLKKYLPSLNVSEAEELDEEFPGYSNKLQEISVYLLNANHQKENYIGFVDVIEETAQEEKTEEKPAVGDNGEKIIITPENLKISKSSKNGKHKEAIK